MVSSKVVKVRLPLNDKVYLSLLVSIYGGTRVHVYKEVSSVIPYFKHTVSLTHKNRN